MIVWLNGAFGVGKTQTAFELHRRIPDSYVFDPEEIGFFLWNHVPRQLSRKGDFQDIPLWRSFTHDMLAHIASAYDGTILVPMTVVNKEYADEIITRLSGQFKVMHIILYADEKIIRKRLSKRLEGQNSFAAQQIKRCLYAFDHNISGKIIRTDSMTVSEAAEAVAACAGLSLSADTRTPLRKFIDRTITQLRHIR